MSRKGRNPSGFNRPMVLSGQTIKNLIKEGKLKIEPYDELNVLNISVDLHLGGEALSPDTGEEFDLTDYHFSLDEFLITNTVEFIKLPGNIVGRIVSKSSLARLGVLTTFEADLLPPNYAGKPILALKNLSRKPILLKTGLAICQIVFEEVDRPVEGYQSRYDHTKPEPGKL